MAKLKQGRLKGMDPPSIKVLDDAAEIYFDAVRERMKLGKSEDEAKDNLIDLMKEHKLTIYRTADGLEVCITNKSNVKVKKNGEEEDE